MDGVANKIQKYEAEKAEQRASGAGNPKALAEKFKFNPNDMSVKLKMPSI